MQDEARRSRLEALIGRRHAGRDTLGDRPIALLVLICALCAATFTLFWLGFRAMTEWQRSADELTERRATEKAALLSVALDRDMKGAQVSVLAPLGHRQLALESPYDLADIFGRAFARFPYTESFFAWRAGARGEALLYVFNRTERRPPWAPEAPKPRYPVVVLQNPEPIRPLLDTIRRAAATSRILVFETTIGSERYQVVASLLHDGTDEQRLFGVAGFMVNLAWVRREYFGELTRQVANASGENDMSLAILDDRSRLVTATRPDLVGRLIRDRPFPLVFLDRALLAGQPAIGGPMVYWTARVSAQPDSMAATAGWRRIFTLLTLAAGASLVALALVARTLRVTADLAAMKSEFVSTVTHELKTPLALIRLIGETLGMGRYSSPATIREYARLLSTEATRLTLLVDNLLMYARVTDTDRAYTFEALDLLDIVEESLERAEPRLKELRFQLEAEVEELPPVRADRQALLQVFDNVIDNAIKYSRDGRTLSIRSTLRDGAATVEIRDAGTGIPDDEVSRVFDKFFRGRDAGATGSGLGLAIAHRIMRDHGGAIRIASVLNRGTTVTIALPLAETA
jgi:signal transduction histidine kinase